MGTQFCPVNGKVSNIFSNQSHFGIGIEDSTLFFFVHDIGIKINDYWCQDCNLYICACLKIDSIL